MVECMDVGPRECEVNNQVKVRPILLLTALNEGHVLFTDGRCWRKTDGSPVATNAVFECVNNQFFSAAQEIPLPNLDYAPYWSQLHSFASSIFSGH